MIYGRGTRHYIVDRSPSRPGTRNRLTAGVQKYHELCWPCESYDGVLPEILLSHSLQRVRVAQRFEIRHRDRKGMGSLTYYQILY